MKDFKLLFIHGYVATDQTDFYPALSKELDKFGIDYVVPNLPGGKHPHANEWLTVIHEAIKDNKKPLIMVGHSLGTRATLLYIEKYQPQVEKVFLIAAFANRPENAQRNGGKTYPDFFTHKIDIEKVKSHVHSFYVLHSHDDSSISFEQGDEIAKDLDAQLIPFEDRDHFSEPENMPYILRVLREKIGF